MFGLFSNKNEEKVVEEEAEPTFSLSTILELLMLQSESERKDNLSRIKENISMEFIETLVANAYKIITAETERLRIIEEHGPTDIELDIDSPDTVNSSIQSMLNLIHLLCRDDLDANSSALSAADIRLYVYSEGFVQICFDAVNQYHKYRCKSEYEHIAKRNQLTAESSYTDIILKICKVLVKDPKIKEDITNSSILLDNIISTLDLAMQSTITLDICSYISYLVEFEFPKLKENIYICNRQSALYGFKDNNSPETLVTLSPVPRFVSTYREECISVIEIILILATDASSLKAIDRFSRINITSSLSTLITDIHRSRPCICISGCGMVNQPMLSEIMDVKSSFVDLKLDKHWLVEDYKMLDEYLSRLSRIIPNTATDYISTNEYATVAREAVRLTRLRLHPLLDTLYRQISMEPLAPPCVEPDITLLATAYRKLEKLYIENISPTENNIMQDSTERYRSACLLLGLIKTEFKQGRLIVNEECNSNVVSYFLNVQDIMEE